MKSLVLLLSIFFLSTVSATEFKLEKIRKASKFTLYNGKTTSGREIPFKLYELKKTGKNPVVFVFTSLSVNFPPLVERTLANRLLRKGFHIVVVELTEDFRDLSRPVDDIDGFLLRSNSDFKVLKNYIKSLPNVDASKLFVAGISLGGIRSSIAFGTNKDILKNFVYVAGSDLPDIFTNSRVKFLKKYRKAVKQRRGITSDQELSKLFHKKIKVKISDLIKGRQPSDVFMILGTMDKIVPYKNQLKLLKAFDYPEHRFVISGHHITGATFLFRMDQMAEFFL